jgi:hypothetical protein
MSFHAYMLSPTTESYRPDLIGCTILDDGAKTTMALKDAGFASSHVRLSDVFLMRTSNSPQRRGDEIRVAKAHPELFKYFVKNHVLESLKHGGEVVLLFGDEVQKVFEKHVRRPSGGRVLRPGKFDPRFNGIDAQIWIHGGLSLPRSWLTLSEEHNIRRRLVISVVHPAYIVAYPPKTQNERYSKEMAAQKLDAALSLIQSLVEGTNFLHQYFGNYLASSS